MGRSPLCVAWLRPKPSESQSRSRHACTDDVRHAGRGLELHSRARHRTRRRGACASRWSALAKSPLPSTLNGWKGSPQFDYHPTGFKLEWMRDSVEDLEHSAEYLQHLIDEIQPDSPPLQPVLLWCDRSDCSKLVVAHSDVDRLVAGRAQVATRLRVRGLRNTVSWFFAGLERPTLSWSRLRDGCSSP